VDIEKFFAKKTFLQILNGI